MQQKPIQWVLSVFQRQNLAALLMTLTVLAGSPQSSAKLVSDSLVKNLDCSRLKLNNVLSFVDRDAFSAWNHFPVQNWGANLLGQCWALSSAQRRFFYMLRTDVSNASVTRRTVDKALELVSAEVASDCPSPTDFSAQYCERKPFRHQPIGIAESHLFDSQLFSSMLDGRGLSRGGFQKQIEALQQKKFYQLGNLGLVTSPAIPSAQANLKTAQALVRSIQQGRMPMVVVRGRNNLQHVVLVKSFLQKTADQISFTVYDSNRPGVDAEFDFDRGSFFAWDIMSRFDPASASGAVGVLLIDESEMDQIQKDLYDYYKRRCQ